LSILHDAAAILHDAAAILRSHPAYAAPDDRIEAVLTLLRSGRFPLLS
jgi:hypothetical protein